MLIACVFVLAVISIGLVIVAAMLRSRSVATLNFIICLGAGIVLCPAAMPVLQPPANEDERLKWIGAVAALILLLVSILTFVYTIIIPKLLAVPKSLRPRKRRRKRNVPPTLASLRKAKTANAAGAERDDDEEKAES